MATRSASRAVRSSAMGGASSTVATAGASGVRRRRSRGRAASLRDVGSRPMAFRILSISDDVEPLEIDGLHWHPLRHRLDVRGFGLNAYSAVAEGDELIEDHTEAADDSTEGHQELYVVLRGAARFTVDGEEHVVPAGSLVFLPDPMTLRHATAAEPDSLVLAVGGQEGKAYAVSDWEDRFRARGEWTKGRREEALAIMRRAAEAHP